MDILMLLVNVEEQIRQPNAFVEPSLEGNSINSPQEINMLALWMVPNVLHMILQTLNLTSKLPGNCKTRINDKNKLFF